MHTTATQLLDINAVLQRTGTKRTKHYEDIKLGLLPQPIKRGDRFARWPSDEIEEVVQARKAGLADAAIKLLVAHQTASRMALAPRAAVSALVSQAG